MHHVLLIWIADTLTARDVYFQQRSDGVGRDGLSTLQKCTTVIRQLTHGTCVDMFEEYLYIGISTRRECFQHFFRGSC
ncbi:hypothetical protein DM860_002614 [Cuscuta australis]|uniref:Secreted protein n=1 Tax=Cuscuta australis TaxID=267555 RepID=A0A328CZL4_9ASTE|nr:hypothetical protein DM860_002614 [Cuscuta australis]